MRPGRRPRRGSRLALPRVSNPGTRPSSFRRMSFIGPFSIARDVSRPKEAGFPTRREIHPAPREGDGFQVVTDPSIGPGSEAGPTGRRPTRRIGTRTFEPGCRRRGIQEGNEGTTESCADLRCWRVSRAGGPLNLPTPQGPFGADFRLVSRRWKPIMGGRSYFAREYVPHRET